jgi:putative transposase
MARHPRIDLPGIPQHVVQRGNNRLPCFLDDEDRARYRQLLREALLASDCRLHAYVLMDNHVHLLVTPPRAGAIGQLMQRLGRRSTPATAAPARCGKAATRPAWSIPPTTCCAAPATSTSTRSAPA